MMGTPNGRIADLTPADPAGSAWPNPSPTT